MKSFSFLVPLFFPIAAALFAAKFARGDQSLAGLFLVVAIVSGIVVFINLLNNALKQKGGAKTIFYIIGAILGALFAGIVSIFIAFVTMLALPVGRV
jgi:lipopolysaccharide export LptBFGC system permease protein LptF